jgi:hypothetical protein
VTAMIAMLAQGEGHFKRRGVDREGASHLSCSQSAQ